MEINEVHIRNSGRDPFPRLMGRHRCPKDRYVIDPSFPVGAMEAGEHEFPSFFSPVDFKIGETIVIYNRRFLIYDFDNFTRAFYWKNFGMTDFTPVDITIPIKEMPKNVRD